MWGPRDATGDVVVVHGNDGERLRRVFKSIELNGRVTCGLCMPYEDGMAIWICRHARLPLNELWSSVKNYD